MTAGRVVGLHRTPVAKLPPERIDEAVVVADFGIAGDRHARPGSSRQVVLTQREVLDELRLAAGATREQLTVSGLGTLAAGDVLEIGTVRLELVRPRVPCRVMDKVRPGLRAELEGRGGWCARVLAGGTMRGGDVVTLGAADDPPWLAEYRTASAAWEAAAFTTGPAADDGWSTPESRLAHLIAWEERAADRIAERASRGGDAAPSAPQLDIDAFNAAAVDRLLDGHIDLWDAHDASSTAVLDAARRWPEHAEAWVRSLTAHYREHS